MNWPKIEPGITKCEICKEPIKNRKQAIVESDKQLSYFAIKHVKCYFSGRSEEEKSSWSR